ncbi:MAG: hydrogenase maturation nickel metallochaperone HypA [Candidatus Bathyarchaeia archaeon]
MHEYSMTVGLVNAVLREAKKKNSKKVIEVHLSVGRLSLLAHDQLRFWYKVLGKGTILEGSKLRISVEEGEVECEDCGYKGPIRYEEGLYEHLFFPTLSCPRCGSIVKVLKGRECIIKSIKMVV